MKKQPEVIEWLAFAGEDLLAAEVLLREEIFNQSCFHSQQVIEKAFKALLISKKKRVPKVHDLNELFQLCLHAGVVMLLPFREQVGILSLYYVPTRYPDAMLGSLPNRMPNQKDAEEAFQIAEMLHEKILAELK